MRSSSQTRKFWTRGPSYLEPVRAGNLLLGLGHDGLLDDGAQLGRIGGPEQRRHQVPRREVRAVRAGWHAGQVRVGCLCRLEGEREGEGDDYHKNMGGFFRDFLVR